MNKTKGMQYFTKRQNLETCKGAPVSADHEKSEENITLVLLNTADPCIFIVSSFFSEIIYLQAEYFILNYQLHERKCLNTSW